MMNILSGEQPKKEPLPASPEHAPDDPGKEDAPGKKTDEPSHDEPAHEPAHEFRLGGISETGSITTSDADGITIHSLVIAGQIEGHYLLSNQTKSTKYEHVIPQLVGVEESSGIDGLLLLINTVGGDGEAGLAIAELIAGMTKPTVSLVLGGGHSIGVPLAVCTDRSFIVPTATMTLHPVRMNGLVVGAPQSFRFFLKMQERITDFILAHSHMEKQILTDLLMATDELATDMGTVVDGKQAVEIGLIDSVGTLSDALNELKAQIRANRQNTEKHV